MIIYGWYNECAHTNQHETKEKVPVVVCLVGIQ